MTAVDVIIPTYNGSELLRDCLSSLRLAIWPAVRVFVYDDGSTEDISQEVASIYPSATVVRSEHNRGLAYGCNRALAAGDAPLVVLLNNDVVVTTDWLRELVGCAERHPDAGSIASKILLHDDRRRIHSAGDFYSCRGVAGNRGVWLEDYGQFDGEREIFAACGAAALYRRHALEAVRRDGMVFDERLFMYYEDVDLAWRLQVRGFRCVFAPRAVVYHRVSATGGGPLASYLVARNALVVLRRSVPPQFIRRYRLRIAAHHAGRVWATLPHVREAAARATLRGAFAGLVAFARERPAIDDPPDETLRRIAGLLAHAKPLSDSGLPVSRLRRGLDADAQRSTAPR